MRSYILQTVVNGRPSATATTNSYENLQTLMREYDEGMKRNGYRRVRYERKHIGKQFMTNVTLHYAKA